MIAATAHFGDEAVMSDFGGDPAHRATNNPAICGLGRKDQVGPGLGIGRQPREVVARHLVGAERRKTEPGDRLTTLGRRVLEAETDRLARVVALARAKNILRRPEPA